ncbi:major facilitator superfamily transporter [Lasiosphaeris hirsuta]|uniref:Major facilitator superfamily transporter n=1 Tax=Lasiosphaeris hirsuta TaxID=260670 RepID=A0AA40BD37_9PEZI|nr:major facilitator superfamily transporter [Lasiosphaeris hirsuta]
MSSGPLPASSAVCDPEKAHISTTTSRLAEYPKGVRLGLIITSLAAAVFLCALDETIIATAIPKITDDFKSINDIGWYGSAYFLTFASFRLIFGKLFTFYSIKHVFLWSIFIFEVGSLVCAVAHASPVFIAGRAIAGLGSAGINAGFIIILAASLPLERRPMFVSSYSGMYGIASVVAPLMGGAFTTHLTWRWCFYINLPIGAAAMAATAFCLRPPSRDEVSATWREKMAQMDLLGTAVLVPGTVCLLLALQWGGSVHAWNSPTLIGLLVTMAVAAVCFIGIQIWKQDQGTVPPRIAKQRSVACSTIYVFCAGGALNLFQYFPPIWFQAIKGMTAFDSGTRILPTTLGTVVFSLVAGFGVSRCGYYTPFMIAGAALLLISTCLTSTWQPSASNATIIGYQIIFGAGAGLGIQQSHTAAQTVLADKDVPTGAVVLIFAQILGGTIWLSAGQNILTSHLLAGLSQVLPDLDIQSILDTGATGLRGAVGPGREDVAILAYNYALTRTFLCAVGLAAAAFVVSLGMEWRSTKPPKPDSDDSG